VRNEHQNFGIRGKPGLNFGHLVGVVRKTWEWTFPGFFGKHGRFLLKGNEGETKTGIFPACLLNP